MLISAASHRRIEESLRKASHDTSLSATKRLELRGKAKRARAVADHATELEKGRQAMATAAAYAKLHREYLKVEHPKVLNRLIASGELSEHLQRVGEEAMQLHETLATQMTTRKDLPEDYAARVKELEQIPHVVWEIVMNDVIYNYPPPKAR